MKIKELISSGRAKLGENNIEDYGIISKVLAKYILNMNDSELIINESKEVSNEVEKSFFHAINEIVNGKPLQYITNKQEFMGLDFYVNENVLIPQPDTEILVEEVINICKKYDEPIKVLDMCTGSGAIAISIAKNVDSANVSASDISEIALDVAKRNAKKNEANIKFISSDMFKNISEKYDIIVSNPPYIKTSVIDELSESVQNEPHLALDGGEDGLKFYRILAKYAKEYLNDNGFLCMEIGFDQKEKVENLLIDNDYSNIYSKKDLSGNDRIVIANK